MGTTTANLGLYKPAINSTVDEDTWGDDPGLNGNADILDSEAALKTVNLDFNDKVLSKPKLKDISEVIQDVTATTSTTIDLEDGNIVNLSHGTNITTLTISNWPPTGNRGYVNIKRIKDNSATERTITWPAAVVWKNGGVAPTLTTSANAADEILLWSDDAGTTIYGSYILQ